MRSTAPSPAAPSRSRRPARSSWTGARRRAGALSRSCPTTTSASCRRTGSSGSCPRAASGAGHRRARARRRGGARAGRQGGAAAHVHLRPVRHLGHRAQPRRGGPRAPDSPHRGGRLMRTVYLGTSEFSVEVLERVAATPHRPVLVVTRPDRPRGRGRRLQAPPVAERAALLGVETIQPQDVNADDARAAIAAAEPEAVLICAYGALVKEPLLSAHPMFNVHPSLLPRWRGAAPIEHAIEAGDEETGVTIMRPIAELDAGPICLERAEPIQPGDDYGSLAARLAALSGELLIEALDTQPAFREQPEQGVTYAEKIEAEDRWLDPTCAA